MRILIATSNAGKLRDFAGAAAADGVEIAGLPNFASLRTVVEDGLTFDANARKKAEEYSVYAPGEIVVADDSGLEIDALNGAPGVHSARYAAPDLLNIEPHLADANTDDDANNARVLRELKDVPPEKRTGRFVCILAAARDGKTLATFRGIAEGVIIDAPRGQNGFGYDPLFYFPQIQKTFAELSAEEKSKCSHRGAAFRQLLAWLGRQPARNLAQLRNRAQPRPLALIFDMDGVLVDSEGLHKRAKAEALRRHGIVLDESVYDRYKGRPDVTMMQEVLTERNATPETIAEILQLKHQAFEAIEHDLRPVPGAVEFLHWAKPQFRLAVATSATPRNRTACLEKIGVSGLFEVTVDTSQFQHPKPDPEIFQVAMQKLGLAARNCWVIEDSIAGVRAGKAADCCTVAITTTFPAAELSAAGADLIVDSFAELQQLLERSERQETNVP
jgi:non-canonical purine NTP pyrophosphatase (RdgB/HAM1 family)